jgi:putative transposase
MSEYRRLYQPGGSYFFTIVTYQRTKILSLPDNITRLKSAMDKVMGKYSFTMEAFVILPDHIHCIWRLPPGDSDYSTRWRLIKGHISIGINEPVNERGEKKIWQRRFWEHVLRDEEDWRRHMDYIHYNPVKHGYVVSPREWPHSSFRQALKDGLYAEDWGSGEPGSISRMDLE